MSNRSLEFTSILFGNGNYTIYNCSTKQNQTTQLVHTFSVINCVTLNTCKTRKSLLSMIINEIRVQLHRISDDSSQDWDCFVWQPGAFYPAGSSFVNEVNPS